MRAQQEAPVQFISIREFCRRSSLSRTTVYEEVARGNLPKPVRLTENRVAFPASVVDAWFEERMKGQ